MACTVILRDVNARDVADTRISMEAHDPRTGIIIDTKSNRFMGPEWGANLSVSRGDVYDVIVDTTSTSYAPPVLETFSGDGSSQLDVVLFSVASIPTPAGSRPQSAGGMSGYVWKQFNDGIWSKEITMGVIRSASTYTYLDRYKATLAQSYLGFNALKSYTFDILQRADIDPEMLF